MRMERTVREIAGDYAVLENETGGTTEVALALLPDGSAILMDLSKYDGKTGLAMNVETGVGIFI